MIITDKKVIKQMMDAMAAGGGGALHMMDAAVAGGMAFLEGELEKRDPKVREPLMSVTWMRDMAVKTGGGFVDWTSVMNVDYGTAGPNMYGLIAGQTNNIPVMQANIDKDLYPVFNWSNVLKVNFIDMKKAQSIGRSLDDLLDRGIRTNWNKSLDLLTYQGFGASAGLLNNTNITAVAVVAGESGFGTWRKKTPMEILDDVNTLLVDTWAASEYDITGMADQILIPPDQYAYISSQLISIAGDKSILTYLMENNIATKQGRQLQIFPSRWCIGAGVNGTDRMIAYVNDEDRVYMDITVPIQRAMTMPDVKEAAYLTLYLGQIGVVKFLYYQCAAYADGI